MIFKENFLSFFFQCNSIRDFDMRFTIKQFGYETCEAYYRDASLDSKIQNIKVPTLFLNAADDMFSPARAFPIEKIRQNPYTGMVITKYGGHISFCEGILPTGCNYTCRILKEYLQHVLNELEEEDLKQSQKLANDRSEPSISKRKSSESAAASCCSCSNTNGKQPMLFTVD
jgi:predicted alpha/beta-fold hydrolase